MVLNIPDMSGAANTIKQTAQIVQVQKNEGEGWEKALDKIITLVDKGSVLLANFDKLSGSFATIANKKNSISSREDGQGNPVLNEKIAARETGRDKDFSGATENHNIITEQKKEVLAGNPVSVPVIQEQRTMKINEEFLENCIDVAVSQISERVPQQWQEKTVKEFIEMYNKPMYNAIAKNFLVAELRDIVKGAIQE